MSEDKKKKFMTFRVVKRFIARNHEVDFGDIIIKEDTLVSVMNNLPRKNGFSTVYERRVDNNKIIVTKKKGVVIVIFGLGDMVHRPDPSVLKRWTRVRAGRR